MKVGFFSIFAKTEEEETTNDRESMVKRYLFSMAKLLVSSYQKLSAKLFTPTLGIELLGPADCLWLNICVGLFFESLFVFVLLFNLNYLF